MTRLNNRAPAILLALPLASGIALGAGNGTNDDENLEFPPMVPDEVITGEIPASAVGAAPAAATAAPAATAPAAATPAVSTAPAPAATAATTPQYAPVQQQGYAQQGYVQQGYAQQGYYPGYQAYQAYQGYYNPGYSAYSGYGDPYAYYGYGYGYGQQPGYYGYGAPRTAYPRYRRPVRKSNSWPFDMDMPWIGGTWTEGPWNNGKFKRGDWLGGGPSEWFQGGNFKEGMAEMWDDMVNAPAEMGTMPGGWEFPTVSTPNPVDVGEELGKAAPEFVDELPNMIEINP